MSQIQIIGTNKCQATRAAIRFFKERRIPFHFVDLNERDLSDGEFQSIARAVGLQNLIDTEGREYELLGLKYQTFDLEARLKENPRLLRTPIVRHGSKAAVGRDPEAWLKFAQRILSPND